MDTISLSQNNHVTTITLNRPDIHNAFDDQLISDLTRTLEEIAVSKNCHLVVIESTGKSFCAGADLNWMKKVSSYSKDENIADAKKLSTMLETLASLPQPTIAKVQGNAYGGGVGIIAACDLAVATDNVKICLSEVKLGLSPAVISPYIINAIGPRLSSFWMLTAKLVSAEEAKTSGLIHEVVSNGTLEEHINKLTDSMSNLGPNALQKTKSLIRRVSGVISGDTKNYCCDLIAELRATNEGKEGVNAFLEKRRPNW